MSTLVSFAKLTWTFSLTSLNSALVDFLISFINSKFFFMLGT